MLRDYWTFSRVHWRYVVFGMSTMVASSFGQTFFIALFGADFRAAFSLTDGELGGWYAIATLCSAVTLTRAGRLIDYLGPRRHAILAAVMLGCGCLLVATAQVLPALVFGLFLLRLFGQGLMVHTGLTTMARAFPRDAGKALSLAALGLPLGEAVLPLLAVSGMAILGWRGVWAVGAVIGITGILFALLPLRGQKADNLGPVFHTGTAHPDVPRERVFWRDRRFVLVVPAIVAVPFISTGFFFHQARLAEEMDWSLAWVALCFVGYAVVRVISMLGVGLLIDRLGPVRLVQWFLLPMAASMLLLSSASGNWVAAGYLMLIGVSSAASSTLATALWMELFGAHQLARVRATMEAGNVLATGISPFILGFFVDHQVALSSQALACAGYCIAATLMAARALRQVHGSERSS